MSKLTKKQKAQAGKIDSNKLYALTDALTLVKGFANAKFENTNLPFASLRVWQTRKPLLDAASHSNLLTSIFMND